MLQRLPYSLGFLTIGVITIAWVMENTGSASARNPAWRFVSDLRAFLLGSIAIAAALFIAAIVFDFFERRANRRRTLEESKEERLKSIEDRIRWIERNMERKEESTERDRKLRERLEQRLEHIESKLNELETARTPDEAIETALNEYGGRSA